MSPNLLDERVTKLCEPGVEKALLAALMTYKDAYFSCKDRLHIGLFRDICNQDLFRAIESVASTGENPDMVLVSNKLTEMHINSVSPYDIAKMTEYKSIANIPAYIEVLNKLATRRKLWEVGMRLVSESVEQSNDIMEVVTSHIESVKNSYCDTETTEISTLNDVLDDVSNTMYLNQSDDTRKFGAKTGFKALDDKGGWQAGNLIIIAADSSQGKSSFALNTTISAMEGGERIAFYSLEMTKEQLVSRMLAAKTSIGSNSILWDKLTYEDYAKVMREIDLMKYRIGNSLFFDDKSSSGLDQILNSIRKQKVKYDITGAVVDYLQILNVNDRNGESASRKMGDAARQLKNLAKELDIWIVALSQLSRDRDNPEPTIARIRDSGEICEAADIVITIYRAEVYGKRYKEPFANKSVVGTALIEVQKGRNIGLCKFLVSFDERRCLFYDPTFPIPDYFEPQQTDSTQTTGFYNDPGF